VFDKTQYTAVLDCEVEEAGAFRAATIFRSKASPSDVVIWYCGSQHYEGLSGGYTLNGTSLRDPDGDAVEWRPQGVAIKVEPAVAVAHSTAAMGHASGLLLLCGQVRAHR
jgi:hypothetical protein